MEENIEIPRMSSASKDILPEGMYNVRITNASIVDSKKEAVPGITDKQIRFDLLAGGKSYTKWFTIPLGWRKGLPLGTKETRKYVEISGEQISRMWEVLGLERNMEPETVSKAVGKEMSLTIQHQPSGDKTYDRIRKIERANPSGSMNAYEVDTVGAGDADEDTPF